MKRNATWWPPAWGGLVSHAPDVAAAWEIAGPLVESLDVAE